jgi:hypothetical protein
MMFDDDERRNEPPAARAEAAPDVAPNASASVSIAAASSVGLTIAHGLYQLHRYRRLQHDESRTSEQHRFHTIPRTEEQR